MNHSMRIQYLCISILNYKTLSILSRLFENLAKKRSQSTRFRKHNKDQIRSIENVEKEEKKIREIN